MRLFAKDDDLERARRKDFVSGRLRIVSRTPKDTSSDKFSKILNYR